MGTSDFYVSSNTSIFHILFAPVKLALANAGSSRLTYLQELFCTTTPYPYPLRFLYGWLLLVTPGQQVQMPSPASVSSDVCLLPQAILTACYGMPESCWAIHSCGEARVLFSPVNPSPQSRPWHHVDAQGKLRREGGQGHSQATKQVLCIHFCSLVPHSDLLSHLKMTSL